MGILPQEFWQACAEIKQGILMKTKEKRVKEECLNIIFYTERETGDERIVDEMCSIGHVLYNIYIYIFWKGHVALFYGDWLGDFR